MLQTIRDKITGVFAYVILGAIAVVFVLWGINYRNEGAAAYAATVNGERIPIETARQAWQDRLASLNGAAIPPELQKSLQQSTLDQLIRSKVVEQRVDRFGYRVADATLIERIRAFPELQVDGKFSRERYASLLHRQGRTETQFEANQRIAIALEDLQAGIVETAFVTPVEAARRYALEKEQRDIDFVLLPASKFVNDAKPTDEDIQKWYDAHQSNYLTQERVDLEYVEVRRADVEPQIKVTDAELQDYYGQVKSKYESRERRRASHILIAVGNGVTDAAAKKTAEEVYAKAKAGGDFAALAKANSKDEVSAKVGGDLDWAERGAYAPEFERALFDMKVGDIAGPVKTQFGYHIIKLDEIEAAHTRPFEEVRAELESDYRKDKSQTAFYDLTQKLADQAFSALTQLDTVATALNTSVKKVTGFTREGGGELGNSKQIIDAAFSKEVLDDGHNSPLVTIGDDRALVLRVASHQPAVPRPLTEVRADVEAKWKLETARATAAKKGGEALSQLQGGASWSKVTADLGVTASGQHSVAREDKTLPAETLAEAFKVPRDQVAADKPRYVGVATADGNYVLAVVIGVHVGDPANETSTDKNARLQRAVQEAGGHELGAYVEGAVKDAKVTRNASTFD